MSPRAFLLHVDRLDQKDGRVWGVQSGGRYRRAHTVVVDVPTVTRFRGVAAAQPRAYLCGRGVLRASRGTITITPT